MSHRQPARTTGSSSNMSAGLGQPKRNVRTPATTGGKLEPMSGNFDSASGLSGARKSSIGAKPRETKPLPKPTTATTSSRPPAGSASSLVKSSTVGAVSKGTPVSASTALGAGRPASTPSGSATDVGQSSATGSPPSNAKQQQQQPATSTASGKPQTATSVSSIAERNSRNTPPPPPPLEAKPAFGGTTTKSSVAKPTQDPVAKPTSTVAKTVTAPKTSGAPPPSKPSPAVVSPSKTRQVAQASTVSVPSVPWVAATEAQLSFVSKRRMELPFSGEYVNLFPDSGVFACIKCKAAVARAQSKVRIANAGYACFQHYSASNLEMELGQYEGQVKVLIVCKKCTAFIGELQQEGEGEGTDSGDCLLVNSTSVRHCHVSYMGKDMTFDQWEECTDEERRKMTVASTVILPVASSGNPSPTKPKAVGFAAGGGAQSPQKSGGTQDEEEDELDEDAAMYLDEDEIERRKASQWGKRKQVTSAKYELPAAAGPRTVDTMVEHSESSESEYEDEEEEEEDDEE